MKHGPVLLYGEISGVAKDASVINGAGVSFFLPCGELARTATAIEASIKTQRLLFAAGQELLKVLLSPKSSPCTEATMAGGVVAVTTIRRKSLAGKSGWVSLQLANGGG